MRTFPPFIQTTDKETYEIDRVYKTRFFIKDETVKSYDARTEKFYGLKDGKEIELEIKAYHPEIYHEWYKRSQKS